MDLDEHAASLLSEAQTANERRLLVLSGPYQSTVERLHSCVDSLSVPLEEWICIGDLDGDWANLSPGQANQLLGRTIPGLIIDATSSVRANVIGQSIGAVEGGGLIILLIGPESTWCRETLASDQHLAVPPYTMEDVGTRFRTRFLETLKQHRGVSIVDTQQDELVADGLIGQARDTTYCPASFSGESSLEDELRTACVTDDQQRCVHALRSLEGDDVAVVQSHRGRGKSAAAGIAAAGFASDGDTVVVTGPGRDAVREVFDRAAIVLETVVEVTDDTMAIHHPSSAGSISYCSPHELDDSLEGADVILVDEAAAIPVNRLRQTLEIGRPVAYVTTTHGYEGTGRGFSVRFYDHLERSGRPIEHVALEEPIRYAMGDPIETWQFRALLLDATPPPREAIDAATPDRVEYEMIDRDALVENEALLRKLFGLLVLAHYRTEPDDLLRLLDAPNISVRALLYDGHPVSVAMLAEEGALDETWCDRLYAGESIRGHMLPDLLTTQLRDRHSGSLRGQRVLRIATHAELRSRGLGSMLMHSIHEEFTNDVDWFGAAFGVTPRLLRFWSENDYHLIHLGTSRNPRSGEHSAVLLKAGSPAGRDLIARHEGRLLERLRGQLADTLDTVDPEIIHATVRAIEPTIEVDLSDWLVDVIEAAAGGPGQVATAPEAFARLSLAGLNAGLGEAMTPQQRHLLIRRTIQHKPLWEAADELDLHLGDARQELKQAIEATLTWYQSDREEG